MAEVPVDLYRLFTTDDEDFALFLGAVTTRVRGTRENIARAQERRNAAGRK